MRDGVIHGWRDAVVSAAARGSVEPIDPGSIRTVVLVEGRSDLVALETLAERMGVGLAETAIVPMGGATSIQRFMAVIRGVRIIGLCDIAEVRYFERAGLDRVFACDPDLEVELIRALGFDAMERVLVAEGHRELFRVFQNQPYQRSRELEVQLHRFLGTTAGRKERYGRSLASAVPIERVPAPLRAVLESISS